MQNKATVIACVNQKGGTGKTCTAENLGIGMVQEGKKVLLVDMDPQASLTISLGYPRPDDLPVTVSDQMAKVMYFDLTEFGKRLHDIRVFRGLTQEELANKLGDINKQHISRMERGVNACSIDLLVELSCALGVSTDYLLTGKDSQKERIKNILMDIIAKLMELLKML